MADFKQLDVLINDAGESLDLVSRALGTFVGKGNATLLDAKPLIDSMIAHSGSLQAIQAFSTAAQKPVTSGGGGSTGQGRMIVVDVGTIQGQYTGPLDPDTVPAGGWRAWGEHEELHNQTGQIFSKAPVLLDPATGKLLTMGDYANVPEDDRPFLPWLRSVK